MENIWKKIRNNKFSNQEIKTIMIFFLMKYIRDYKIEKGIDLMEKFPPIKASLNWIADGKYKKERWYELSSSLRDIKPKISFLLVCAINFCYTENPSYITPFMSQYQNVERNRTLLAYRKHFACDRDGGWDRVSDTFSDLEYLIEQVITHFNKTSEILDLPEYKPAFSV